MEENNVITIEIPEDITIIVQRYDIERTSRRDILIYLLQNDINIDENRFTQYQKEYDEKYFAFDVARGEIEKYYVRPLVNNRKCDWSLDYATNIITINLME